MRGSVLLAGSAALVACLALLMLFLRHVPVQRSAATSAKATPGSAASAATGPVEDVVVAGDEAVRLGARMRQDEGVANDVVFLIAAALRGRCEPAHAHDLPRMAVMAHVPALAAGGGEHAPDGLRRDVSHVVNAVVGQASCRGPVALHIGTYTRELAPDIYAEAFPDSYFAPELSAVPSEFKGMSLAQRVADRCTPVAYATLPLDAARAWQCAGLRADARSSILRLCQREGASPDQAAVDIHHLIGSLPATCQ